MGGAQIKHKHAKGTKPADTVITEGADYFDEILGDWDNNWGPKIAALSTAQKD